MREILFRAKTIDGDWTYGYYVFAPKRTGMFGQTIGSADFDRHYILTMKYNLVKEVIPETVGQYTGLTDKNGNKIFEGDILFYEYGDLKKRGFVFYYERGAKFGIKENDTHDNLSLLHDTQVKAWNIKVIGNIHDNPELLKESGKG